VGKRQLAAVSNAMISCVSSCLILPTLTQLGVDNTLAVVRGGLSGKPQFFGSSTAETTSIGSDRYAGWDEGWSGSAYASYAWFTRSDHSAGGATAGIAAFTAASISGGVADHISHRAILSGY
jgi:hypothetical protein